LEAKAHARRLWDCRWREGGKQKKTWSVSAGKYVSKGVHKGKTVGGVKNTQ